MDDSNVRVKIPPNCGNQPVTDVATPSKISEKSPRTCSRTKIMIAITPTAKKPGISRTECNKPISPPSKLAISTTKLLSNALHVANAIGMAAAMTKSKKIGLRQIGDFCASAKVIICTAMPPMAVPRPKFNLRAHLGNMPDLYLVFTHW